MVEVTTYHIEYEVMRARKYNLRTLLLAVAAVAVAVRLIQASWHYTYVLPSEQGQMSQDAYSQFHDDWVR